MYPFLKAVHFISLALLVAAPAFLGLVWEPAARAALPQGGGHRREMVRRIRPLVAVGALLFAASGVFDALRAASQIFPLTDSDLVRLFFTRTSYGRLTVAKVALTAVSCAYFFLIGNGWRRLFLPLAALASVAVVYTVSGASHAAGKPGLFPLLSDMVHVIASAIWAGGLVYLGTAASKIGRGDERERARQPEPSAPPQSSGSPWSAGSSGAFGSDEGLSAYRLLYALVERFSTLALISVGFVAATGAYAAYLHVYDVNAAVSTPYGRALIVKLALFAAVVGVAGYNLMLAGPSLRRGVVRRDLGGLRQTARRFSAAVRLEAVVVTGVLIAAGVLTTLPPADTPGTVVAGMWELSAGAVRATVELAPLDRPGGLSIAVTATSAHGQPLDAGARVEVLLEMTSHRMVVGPLAPERVAPGRYQAATILPMDGPWRMRLRVAEAGRPPEEAAFDFEAATGTMLSGRVRRFEPAAAVRTPVRQFTSGLGLILVALGAYAVTAGRRRRLVPTAIPLGVAMVALGGYHLLSTTLTDSIPTSHVPNPVPYTLEAVERGAALFAQHCAVCHGPEGKGDGILAAALNPPPADLTAEHVDEHTDGDIFWWITYGIEQTAMPAMGNVLSEEERWTIIHFVRSLRHFMPALEPEGSVGLDPGNGRAAESQG